MKLKISTDKDVQILSATGDITPHEVDVLRAGIKSLFLNGKNQIVIELSPGQTIPSEVLRELAMLDILARELSGRIVLAGVSPEVSRKIEAFAKPPVIPCFASRAEALRTFLPEPPKAPAPPPIAAKPAPPPAKAPAQAPVQTPTPTAPSLSKDEFRNRELADLGTLRKQVSQLDKENVALREQIQLMLMERRTPPDALAFQAKIKALEAELEKAITPAAKSATK